jgi:hypothetical protein
MSLSQRIAAVATHLATNASEQSSVAQRDAVLHAIASWSHNDAGIVQADGATYGVPWFSTVHRDAVMTALTQASAAKSQGAPWTPQVYHNFASMLPANVWGVLCDSNKDVNHKCTTLFCCCCGRWGCDSQASPPVRGWLVSLPWLALGTKRATTLRIRCAICTTT